MKKAKSASGETPLSVEVQDGDLVIRIGINVLAFACDRSNDNNPFDDLANDFRQTFKVADPLEFAKDVRIDLCAEREDGSTLMTDLLDKVCMEAIYQGSAGVQEVNKLHRGKRP